MSYNGIGLSTARGSGTNGYIQKSLSHVKHKPIKHKDAVHYSSAPSQTIKPANQSILMHERLRLVEIKCLEMEDLLLDQGLDQDDVEEQVDELRKSLVGNLDKIIEKEEILKINHKASNTHQLAERKEKDNEKFGKALGIKETYTPGSSFSADRQEERKREREEEKEQKKRDYEERKRERDERDKKYREEKEARRIKYDEEKELKRVEREKRYLEDEEERRLKREAGEVVERSRSRSPQRRRDSNRRSRSPDSRRSCERRGRSRPPIEKPSTEIRKRRRFASKSKSRSPVKKAANGAASPKDNFVKNGAASAKGSSVSPPARKSVSVSPPRRRAATPSSE